MHAGALDEALGQGRLELDALVHVFQSIIVVALEVPECASHVVSERLELLKTSELERAVEGCCGLCVALRGLGSHLP